MNDNLYRRELVGWAVNKLGSALGWSLFATVAIALFGAVSESLAILSLAGLVGAAVFALILSNSRPPWPENHEPTNPLEDLPRRTPTYRRTRGKRTET